MIDHYNYILKNKTLNRKELIESLLYNKILQLKIKRVIDILLSLILIIILSPLLIIVSLLIVMSSKGPVFYSNKRIGLFQKHFHCLKFRSMVIDKYNSQEDLKSYSEAKEKGFLFKKKKDTRVTWIGKIIRRSSIDELPQLFNVLNGDMSIVGPRPLVPFMLDNLEDFNNIRSLLKPGITGKWQTENRINNTSALFMVEHDVDYIEMYSLLNDLKILLKTPKVVISTKGAY